MNISKIGLVALLAGVCSSAGAATLDVSVTSDADSQFTYSATIFRDDAVSVNQFQFAFNSADAAASISNVLNPFGWTSAVESAADSGWRYSAADDPDSGDYGLSAGSFDMPAAVLSFRFDVAGQAAARQDLDAANDALSGGFRDLTNAQELQVVRQAAILNAQSALDQAQTELTAAEGEVTTAEQFIRIAEQRRNDRIRVLREIVNDRKRELNGLSGFEFVSALQAVKIAEADLENYGTQSAQAIADLDAAIDPARQEATRLRNVVASKATDKDLAVETLAAARLSEQQAVSDIAQARIQQSVAQDVSTKFAQASLSYQSDPIANAAAVESVQRTALAVDNAEQSLTMTGDQISKLEAALPAAQASLDAAKADLVAVQPAIEMAQFAVDALERRGPSPALTEARAELAAAQEIARPLEAVVADRTAEYNLIVNQLTAAMIAQSDAIEELADLRILAAAARAELALYPGDAGRELSGFSYMSVFGPISGPALLTGQSANQTVGVLVAGEATMPAVPLPASTLLLLTGLAGFGALRRSEGKRVVS